MNPYSRAARILKLARTETALHPSTIATTTTQESPVESPETSISDVAFSSDVEDDIFSKSSDFICSTPKEKEKSFIQLQPVSFNQAEPEHDDANRTYTILPGLNDVRSPSPTGSHADQELQMSDQENNNQHEERKRKKKRSKAEMQSDVLQKKRKLIESHAVLPGCDQEKCPFQCHVLFQGQARKSINLHFWSKTSNERKQFLREMIVIRKSTSTKKNSPSRKTTLRTYRLRDARGEYLKVCQTFFLNTLGQLQSNDNMIRTAFKGVNIDDQSNSSEELIEARGSSRKFDHDLIKKDIESYNPSVPHYRREHAPNRRYLPFDLTVKDMHSRYVNSSGVQCSYQLYNQIFRSMNIAMTKLGHEECEVCKEFDMHKKSCHCQVVCNVYSRYAVHHRNYREARQQYKEDAAARYDPNKPIFAADLQKVLLLPMIDQFKKAIFTSRLVCFNETFAPISKSSKRSIAVLWHEAICGRFDEDIASAFQKFLLEHRDCEEITIWADNCPGQNKNWTLLTMLCDTVNASEVRLARIKIKFFEPGHSFMAADSTHAVIESVLKRKKASIQDYKDLQDAIQDAGCHIKDMQVADFRNYVSGLKPTSKDRRNTVPYLADIVHAEFRRGSKHLFFKTSHFSHDLRECSFLKESHDPTKATVKTTERGVKRSKKDLIIKNLLPLMDEHKKAFWMELPTSDASADLLSASDVTPDKPQH